MRRVKFIIRPHPRAFPFWSIRGSDNPGGRGGWQEFRPHLTEEEKEEPRVITLVEVAGETSSQVWDFLVCIAIASSLAGGGKGGLR